MPNSFAVPNRTVRGSVSARIGQRFERRAWPVLVSILFVSLGALYVFRWGPAVMHVPELWISPQDLWFTFLKSNELVHGQFGQIYQIKIMNYLEYPGILVALAPLAIFSGSFQSNYYHLTKTGAVLVKGASIGVPGVAFLNPQELGGHGQRYVLQPQWVAFVDPYVLALSCIVLFCL